MVGWLHDCSDIFCLEVEIKVEIKVKFEVKVETRY